MSTQVVLQGRLLADGTLELDEKVPMPSGPVLVTVQPLVQPPPGDPFWQRMESVWAAQKTRGHRPRSRAEIDDQINALRGEAEEELRAVERLHEQCRQARDQKGPSPEAPN